MVEKAHKQNSSATNLLKEAFHDIGYEWPFGRFNVAVSSGSMIMILVGGLLYLVMRKKSNQPMKENMKRKIMGTSTEKGAFNLTHLYYCLTIISFFLY